MLILWYVWRLICSTEACAVCYQYGVWDATELITRNARDYMFFDELNSAIELQ